ncbi:MAG: ribonuclease III [Pseudomonadota bacterium]
MKLSKDLDAFCDRLGYRFKNLEFLIEALTHSSLSSETRRDNQRMEFLGDRVLALTIATALYHRDTEAEEGELAPRFNALVRKEACAEVAEIIDVGSVLKLGRSEMKSGGRRKQAILGDAMESVLAAVYLDSDFETAEALTQKLWAPVMEKYRGDMRDAKTMLQEWAQAQKMPAPNYKELARRGPDHEPEFDIQVTLENGMQAQATAKSKRLAQQEAAAILLAKVDP